MSTVIVPYNQAMRLGQGYNTYLQQICIDGTVSFDPGAVRTGPSGLDDVSTLQNKNNTPSRQDVLANTSQNVTYKTAFADTLSDVVETFNISAAAGIRSGTLSASGSAAYVDENKFKESNINFVVNVRVTNDKTELDQEKLTFNEIKSAMDNPSSFTEYYGDGFISGFITGGELNAIVNIKVQDAADIADIKTLIQVSMKMVSANGSEGSYNPPANKAVETNITINWSGGGQIQEPKAEWSIESLLEAAAEFPSKVAECPQRTWAIITKYKHLRDYVEKVQKPTFIEYELAASHTAVLLDNFIEYKLMLKTIGAIMEKMSDYEESSASNAYAMDTKTLVGARMDIQMEMAKIVLRVNEINLDPKKALELAKPLVQGASPSHTDSHLYSARLPVTRNRNLPPTPEPTPGPTEPLPLWVATPRSKLDPIIWTTTNVGNAPTCANIGHRTYKFFSPRLYPPQFATGITYLHVSCDSLYRLKAEITDQTTKSFSVSLISRVDTKKYGEVAGATWFEVVPTDPDFQLGSVSTFLGPPSNFPADIKVMSEVRFPRLFNEYVEVLIWLTYLELHAGQANFITIDTLLQDINRKGFQLWYGTAGDNNYTYGLGYSWIAYPKSKKGVESGLINQQWHPPSTLEGYSIGEVGFKKEFKKTPRVWLAWSGMKLADTRTNNFKLKVEVVGDSVTTTGFKYRIDLYGKVIVESLSYNWIALELD